MGKSEDKKQYIIYVDTGGTFSDAVIVSSDGTFVNGKASTTPDDLEQCLFNCIEDAAKRLNKSLRQVLSDTEILGFGTTAGTNTILTRSGAPNLGFITTRGFEDTTMIGRASGRWAGRHPSESIHIPTTDRPEPLIPRERIRGVTERTDSVGLEAIPLYEEEARQAVRELLDRYKVEGIAVSFLWSFLNDAHEKRMKEIIGEIAPELPVSLSSETVLLIRESSRCNSTITNLYIGSEVRKLFGKVKKKLGSLNYTKPLLVMQAAGGLSRSEVVKPITTLHSGPVGGLVGVEFIRDLYGFSNVMGSDVGGTSFDVCLVPESGAIYVREPVVANFILSNPMREIISIGAGGGTIAYIDELTRVLRVGPKSAGSQPGPVCYGRGGTQPTVTDADVVTGRIDPDYFLGGSMKLDREAARKAIKEKIADPLKMGVEEAAQGITTIIDAVMANTLASTLRLRGADPAKFTLLAFGGAGPTHCAGYSAGIGFERVMVFPYSATFSAFGASTGDIYHRYESSPYVVIPRLPYNVVTGHFEVKTLEVIPSEDLDRYNRIVEMLSERAYHDMAEEGFRKGEVRTNFLLEMRYGGQLHEVSANPKVVKISGVEDLREIVRAFEEEYVRLYTEGAMAPEFGIEIITAVIEVSASVAKPAMVKKPCMGEEPKKACKGNRQVWFDLGYVQAGVYEMKSLEHGNMVSGPAIIEGTDTTFVVPPDRVVRVDEYLNFQMTEKKA